MFRRYERSGLLVMALPLYSGPVLAGWIQAPLALPAALAAMFFLAQLMAGKAETRGSLAMPVFLGLLAATQVVVVGLVYAMGLLLALLLGQLPAPLWLPLLMTGFGAVLLVRRYQDGPQDAQMSRLLDEALTSIESGTSFDPGDVNEPGSDPEVNEAVLEAITALWDLPEDVSYGTLDTIVQRLEERVGARGFWGMLAEIDEGYPQIDRAMLRYLAAPPVRSALVDSGDIGIALDLLVTSTDPATLGEFSAIILTLLDESAPLHLMPDTEDLQQKPELVRAAELVEAARRSAEQ